MLKNMNLPNKLTILRIALVPFYILFMYLSVKTPSMMYVAGLIFIIASLTDMLDGRIARARNLVTNFGKFLDPIADKILVLTALLLFIDLGRLPMWTAIIVVAREIWIAALRNIAVLNGRVVAADSYGKIKTMTQMVSLSIMHFEGALAFMVIPDTVIFYISMLFTVISWVNYTVNNKDVLKED